MYIFIFRFSVMVVSYHHMCRKILGGIFMLVCRDVPCSMYCVKLSPKLRLDIELSVVKMTPSVFSGEYIKALPEYVLKPCFVLIINEGLVVLILLMRETGCPLDWTLSKVCPMSVYRIGRFGRAGRVSIEHKYLV